MEFWKRVKRLFQSDKKESNLEKVMGMLGYKQIEVAGTNLEWDLEWTSGGAKLSHKAILELEVMEGMDECMMLYPKGRTVLNLDYKKRGKIGRKLKAKEGDKVRLTLEKI